MRARNELRPTGRDDLCGLPAPRRSRAVEQHVCPIRDLRRHWLVAGCHCSPRIEHEGRDTIVIHNAYDGRK